MRLRFDQLGKQIGKEALAPAGTTVAHDEIAPDAQHADLRHEPDPRREAERARLGLLGRLAAVVCLIEIFGHAPGEAEVRACIGKLIAFGQKRARIARRKGDAGSTEPFLWIIAAGRPAAALAALGARPAPEFPPGVYLGPELLHMGLVVASELPRDRSTLLIRLMAAGPLLSRAIDDLDALPENAHERALAEPILISLQHTLENRPNRTPEEEAFIVKAIKTWADARRETRTEERARSVMTVLRVRGVAVPAAAQKRILAEKDPERLERWLERAVVAASITEVIDEPS
jgi:hypothetical protein